MFEKISELVEHKDEELGKVKASLRSERVIRAELETKLRKQELELRMVAAERERWSERVTSKSSPTSGKRWDEMAGGTGGANLGVSGRDGSVGKDVGEGSGGGKKKTRIGMKKGRRKSSLKKKAPRKLSSLKVTATVGAAQERKLSLTRPWRSGSKEENRIVRGGSSRGRGLCVCERERETGHE